MGGGRRGCKQGVASAASMGVRDRYYGYIDNETLSMLEENIKLTENLKPDDLSILNTCYVYSQVDGMELPKIESIDGTDVADIELREPILEQAAFHGAV